MSEQKIIDGIEYSKWEKDSIWIAYDAPDALMVCDCGNRTFSVKHSGDFETSAQCTICNKSSVVHSG